MKRDSQTTAERTRILRQTLVQLFELQIHAGASPSDLAGIAHECVVEAQSNAQVREEGKSGSLDAQDYGSVLKTWHRQGEYLSKEGFPRPLAIEGKYGLRRLIGSYYPRERFPQILKSLHDSGLVARQSNGKWTPTARSAVFPMLNSELLAHLAEGVSRLIETVSRNVTLPAKEFALFERSTKVRSLPMTEAIAFRRFVLSQGSAFLGAVDDWLEARAKPESDRRGKTCTAGVFTFAFIDEAKSRKSRRPTKNRQSRI